MNKDEMSVQQDVMLDKLDPIKESLTSIPNVVAVGIGLKETDGGFTNEIAYRVFVDRKRPLSELGPDEIIPPVIDGIKTDVLTPYVIKPRPGVCGTERLTQAKHRPLQAGISVSNNSTGSGTLGWFGTLDSDGTTVLLTNEHVIGSVIDAKVAQPILGCESDCCCCTCGEDDAIGKVVRSVTNSTVDCGIARIDTEFVAGIDLAIVNNIGPDVITVANPPTAAAVVGSNVRKIGIRSGLTRGIVVHIGDVAAAGTDPAGGVIAIRPNQVLVIPDPAETYQVSDMSTGVQICKFAFSNSGDSGSAIVDANDQIVALLFAGDETTNSVDITFACNIASVLAALSAAGSAITLSSSPPGRRARFKRVRRENPAVNLRTEVPITVPQEVTVSFLGSVAEANRQSWLFNLYEKHHREILRLINHCRPVTVAWQRGQGPAYVAALARAAREPAYRVPYSVGEISREHLLNRLRVVLIAHGSDALTRDIERFGDDLIAAAIFGDTIERLAENMKQAGFIDVLPSSPRGEFV